MSDSYDKDRIKYYLDRAKIQKIHDQLEGFLKWADMFILVVEKSEEERKRANKKLRKALENMEKGKHLDEIFDADAIEELAERDSYFREAWTRR